MTVNIYDNANEMAEVLRQLPQFAALQAAFGKMKADPIAYAMYQQMQQLQGELQQKQMAGQEVTDDDVQKLRDLGDKLMKIDMMKELMDREREMNSVMDEINNIVTKPITDLYRG
ncbi:YlbF family regulator [Lapidilactobacillus bayanensis]|uniref:YlbF family regulator n=1 Tax=Lapidilactobacillus bayanensis TaxID=2485998 RepID=UPI000F7AC314|nr:YlbF family regulator [Lapidilactobacillus bayanensis]